ncbi:MAG: hypothetical protein MUE40_09205 [Anaerolineae bacterium]|jgi:hypothetical protein|nr:hypothetical protein [Anaerolineae bacterium]
MQKDLALFYELHQIYRGLRDTLLAALHDDHLALTLPGNMTLGELCRELGEIHHAYTQSFHTLKMDFGYRHPDPAIAGSVARLQAWYAELDAALAGTLAALTDDDVAHKKVDRSGGFEVGLPQQLEILRDCLLLFYGKASIYIKAHSLPVPPQWHQWVG